MHRQRIEHQVGRHPWFDRPANHFAVEQVDHDRQIQPALGGQFTVSPDIGHGSVKTRKYYGTAHQARDRHAVRPVRIEADFPVRALPIQARLITQAHINSKHSAEMG